LAPLTLQLPKGRATPHLRFQLYFIIKLLFIGRWSIVCSTIIILPSQVPDTLQAQAALLKWLTPAAPLAFTIRNSLALLTLQLHKGRATPHLHFQLYFIIKMLFIWRWSIVYSTIIILPSQVPDTLQAQEALLKWLTPAAPLAFTIRNSLALLTLQLPKGRATPHLRFQLYFIIKLLFIGRWSIVDGQIANHQIVISSYHHITFLCPTHTKRLFTYSGLVNEALPAGLPPVT
jgi:hypothetical protein